MKFTLKATAGRARRGRLELAHGAVETPGVHAGGHLRHGQGDDAARARRGRRADRPRQHVPPVAAAWHRRDRARIAASIASWAGTGPILTDSGGFQVWSLGALRKVRDEGVTFASPVNGDKLLLTPEISMQVQRALDADVVMVFDECTPYPATRDEAARSMELSLALGAPVPHAVRRRRKPERALRHRPGRHARGPARCIAGRPRGHRLRRLRDRRPVRRRAQGRDAADSRPYCCRAFPAECRAT